MREITDLVTAIVAAGPDAPLRLRQGKIISVAADSTATVTVGGSTTQIPSVKVASHVCPIPGATCWLATDGQDWFVLATLAPAGPAYATMRKSTTQSVATNSWVALAWGSRTETVAIGTTLGSGGITIDVPGLYSVEVCTGIEGFTSSATTLYTRLTKNSTVISSGNGAQRPNDINFVGRHSATATIKCAIGDVLNAEVYQNSGGSLTLVASTGHNVLNATWLGPAA